MRDFKMEAASASLRFISTGQIIGLGAGTTIKHLVNLISQNRELSASLIFVTSSFKTRAYLDEKGLKVQSSSMTKYLDTYFDGCDQFDEDLNALKSGGGIHTSEKVLSSLAIQFILTGDEEKYASKLNNTYPLVIEILPEALSAVLNQLQKEYPQATVKLRMSTEKDGAVITENGNYLADVKFNLFPELDELNVKIKMIPGIVEHSLFYRLANKAVIAGENGIRILSPAYSTVK